MYVTSKEMLQHAAQNGYAVGAFNAENAEMVWAIVAAAEEARAPVMIQTTPSTLRYFAPGYFAALVKRAGQSATVPVCLHLDHGSSYELAEECLREGYSSVMIDGSALPYEENITLSKRVCTLAKEFDVPVEGELGVIGGKEDDTVAEGDRYTSPRQAANFAERTGVSSLAISVGTAHGFYKTEPKIDFERIAEAKALVPVPLVLHGASGLADDVVSKAVGLGMAKVNFATELRDAYTRAVRAFLQQNPKAFDPKQYGTEARNAVKALVLQKMRICKCEGRA